MTDRWLPIPVPEPEGRIAARRWERTKRLAPGERRSAVTPHSADDPAPVACFREVLSPPPAYEFPITDLDHLDVPVWTTAQWHDGEMVTSTGYGRTDDRARIGAWGELAERAVRYTLPDLPSRRASYGELSETGVDAIDPRRLRLPVTTDYDHGREIEWIEATRYPSEESVWVPIEAAATAPSQLPESAPDPLFTPVTNGLGAGDSLERALSHALCELIQRDGNSVSYRATDRGVEIDLSDVADPEIGAILDRYEEAGLDVQVKLADTPLDIVSLYVVGAERDPRDAPHPLTLTGCGEGAHPDREVALKKALLEFAASRVRKRFYHAIDPIAESDLLPEAYRERVRKNPPGKGEQRAYDAMCEWLELDAEGMMARIDSPIFDVNEQVALSSLPTVASGTTETPADLLDCVAKRYEAADMEVCYVDLSPDPTTRVVKAIVPGMEVETMTYDRIGPRNLQRLFDRDSDLAGLLADGAPESARRVPLTEADEAAVGGPAWFDPEAARRVTDGLYALYREPARHAIAMHGDLPGE